MIIEWVNAYVRQRCSVELTSWNSGFERIIIQMDLFPAIHFAHLYCWRLEVASANHDISLVQPVRPIEAFIAFDIA